jgi:hypothetical protein
MAAVILASVKDQCSVAFPLSGKALIAMGKSLTTGLMVQQCFLIQLFNRACKAGKNLMVSPYYKRIFAIEN